MIWFSRFLTFWWGYKSIVRVYLDVRATSVVAQESARAVRGRSVTRAVTGRSVVRTVREVI